MVKYYVIEEKGSGVSMNMLKTADNLQASELLSRWILAVIETAVQNQNASDNDSVQSFVEELKQVLGIQGE